MHEQFKATVVALALAFAVVTANAADTLLRGDVVAGVDYIPVMCPAPASVFVFSPDLVGKSSIYENGKVAVDGFGHTYVLSDIITPLLDVLDTQFQRIRSIELLEPSSSFTVDDTGRAYVVGESGLVRVYSPEGKLVLTFTLPNVNTPVRDLSMDIAPDRCMLVYAPPNGAAQRYDVCSGTSLPAVGSNFDAVRALRGGGFAGAIIGTIELFDGNGHLVSYRRSPTADRVNALAFSADSSTLLLASGSQIFVMSLAGETVRAETKIDSVVAKSLAVFGEERPSATSFAPKRRSARH